LTISSHIPAVILVLSNNPMRFSDRSGAVPLRRVILRFPEVIPVKERDPLLMDKISAELAVIVRPLMQRFTSPDEARELLQAQQTSGEALEIKRQADPLVDFCGYLMPLSTPNGLFIGNATFAR
jgi:putative DNA primase/helicase